MCATTFNISDIQFYRTLEMLSDDGYIKELTITPTKSRKVVGNLSGLAITSSGLQYLAENSMMQKAYKVFKEVKDWLPLI